MNDTGSKRTFSTALAALADDNPAIVSPVLPDLARDLDADRRVRTRNLLGAMEPVANTEPDTVASILPEIIRFIDHELSTVSLLSTILWWKCLRPAGRGKAPFQNWSRLSWITRTGG